MSTTTLFAELLVIGVGATTWVCLLLLAAFGYDWVPLERLFTTTAAVPVLAVIYLLGILTDRLADSLLGRHWSERSSGETYKSNKDRYAADKALVMADGQFGKLFEYNKSRQRICRGWTFNAVAILLALHAFLWVRFEPDRAMLHVAVLGSLFLGLLAWGCWYSGRQLNGVQYKKVKQQAAFIRSRANRGR